MISIPKLLEVIEGEVMGEMIGHPGFRRADSLTSAQADSLIWIKGGKHDPQEIVNSTRARTIIVPANAALAAGEGQVLIAVENPRLSFIKVLQAFFVERPEQGVHPTAWVHPDASIDPTAYIGPFTSIGRSTVGAGTVIHSNVSIYDGVTIGANVIVHAGTVIGADGFGFERNENGEVFKFPHVGGVIIEDEVEIGANTCIDRGTLDDTILRRSSKVDNLVHIAHNVEVGARAFVIAHAMVAGSVSIGEGAWVSPSSAIMNGKSVGADALVGMSALVTKDVPAGEVWAGVPASPLQAYKAQQRELKRLVNPGSS